MGRGGLCQIGKPDLEFCKQCGASLVLSGAGGASPLKLAF